MGYDASISIKWKKYLSINTHIISNIKLVKKDILKKVQFSG